MRKSAGFGACQGAMRWAGRLRRGLERQARGLCPWGDRQGQPLCVLPPRDRVGACRVRRRGERVSDPEEEGGGWAGRGRPPTRRAPKPETLVTEVRHRDLTFPGTPDKHAPPVLLPPTVTAAAVSGEPFALTRAGVRHK